MGAYNNPVVLPYQPSTWERTVVPTMTQLLGNLALAKIQHGWQMDIADKQLQAQQIAAKRKEMFEKEKIGLQGKQARKTAATTAALKPTVLGPGEKAVDISGAEIATGGPKTPTTAMAAYLQQNPNATPEQLMQFSQGLKGKGFEMTMPDGTVVRMGGPAGRDQMTTKTLGAVEDEFMKASSGLQRVVNIADKYDNAYLEYGPRINAAWTGFKSKAGFTVPEQDREFLKNYSEFRQDAVENINLYIKEITGAQMSESEADRLMKAMPNPGFGVFDGDDPITFKSKLNTVIKKLRTAKAKYHYIRKQGFSVEDVPLEKMPDIMKTREKQLVEILKESSPGIKPDVLRQKVRERLSDEFGLGL